MKILVTGGTGFLGRPVVGLLLEQGHEVLLVTRHPESVAARWPRAFILAADDSMSNKARTLSRCGPDTFLHMAWEGLPDYSPEQSCRNLEMGAHYLSLALDSGVRRIVGVGTCLEYGACHGPQLETNAPAEIAESFPQAKIALHSFIRSVVHEHDLEYRWARPFFVYGPGQRETSLIPSALRAARVGKRMAPRDKSAAVDFVHVTDVARGICTLTTDSGPSGAFNLGSGSPRSTQWIADTVFSEASGLNCVEGHDRNVSDGDGWWADISYTESSYGWRPTISIQDGIRQLVASGIS